MKTVTNVKEFMKVIESHSNVENKEITEIKLKDILSFFEDSIYVKLLKGLYDNVYTDNKFYSLFAEIEVDRFNDFLEELNNLKVNKCFINKEVKSDCICGQHNLEHLTEIKLGKKHLIVGSKCIESINTMLADEVKLLSYVNKKTINMINKYAVLDFKLDIDFISINKLKEIWNCDRDKVISLVSMLYKKKKTYKQHKYAQGLIKLLIINKEKFSNVKLNNKKYIEDYKKKYSDKRNKNKQTILKTKV